MSTSAAMDYGPVFARNALFIGGHAEVDQLPLYYKRHEKCALFVVFERKPPPLTDDVHLVFVVAFIVFQGSAIPLPVIY